MAHKFFRADIVVGLHGAGLTNAALSPEGVVLVELKSHFNRASDLFKKIAQGRSGGYMWVNTEQATRGGVGYGQMLNMSSASAVANCAASLWRKGKYSAQQRQRPASFPPLHQLASLSCACAPVGGGTSTAKALPGIYGVAPVGHADECPPAASNSGSGGNKAVERAAADCHAGMVTSPGAENCPRQQTVEISPTEAAISVGGQRADVAAIPLSPTTARRHARIDSQQEQANQVQLREEVRSEQGLQLSSPELDGNQSNSDVILQEDMSPPRFNNDVQTSPKSLGDSPPLVGSALVPSKYSPTAASLETIFVYSYEELAGAGYTHEQAIAFLRQQDLNIQVTASKRETSALVLESRDSGVFEVKTHLEGRVDATIVKDTSSSQGDSLEPKEKEDLEELTIDELSRRWKSLRRGKGMTSMPQDILPQSSTSRRRPPPSSLAERQILAADFKARGEVRIEGATVQEGVFEDDDELKKMPKRRTQVSSSRSAAQRKRNREARLRTPSKIPPAFTKELVEGKRSRVMMTPDLANFFGAPKAALGSGKQKPETMGKDLG